MKERAQIFLLHSRIEYILVTDFNIDTKGEASSRELSMWNVNRRRKCLLEEFPGGLRD